MASGSRYEGDWKEDKKNGLGTTYNADGSAHFGIYTNNKKDGLGKFTTEVGIDKK